MADVVSIELYKEADFNLAGLLVRPSLNRVEKDGKAVRLEPKIMKVLLVLWRAGGGVVSRERLIEEVWEGQIVTDDAITRTISRLRKLFSEDFPVALEIETVQKTGYRLAFSEKEEERQKKRPGTLVVLGTVLLLLGGLGYFLYPKGPDFPNLDNLFAGPVRPLTSFPGKERFPVFSPDGNYVLFSWADPKSGVYDVYRMDLNSRDLLQLTQGEGHKTRPVWSPDGTRIAYFKTGAGRCSIHLQSSIGGADRKIANCPGGDTLALDFAPDNDVLLAGWREAPFGQGKLYSIDLDSLEISPIPVEGDFPLGVDDAFFSPDGRQIAVSLSRTLGVEDLYLLPREGGIPIRITEKNLKIHDLKFLPGGDRVLASTNWLGAFGIWVVPLDGAPAYPVGNLTHGVDGIGISREGLVVIEVWQEEAGIFELDTTEKTLEPLQINSTRFDWDGQFSPDGTRLALVSDRGGSAEAWVWDRQSGHMTKLSDFGGPWTHSPRWSPDGQRLVFSSPVEGRFDLFLVNPEDGRLQYLTNGQGNNFAPAWSPDGRYIYFGSDRAGSWQIWRLEVETGLQELVVGNNARTAKVSPDGETLYFTRIDMAGLWRLSLSEGANAEKILENPVPVDWNTWAVTENEIFFIRRRVPSKPELMRFDLASETSEIVMTLPDLLHNSGLWVSGDGQRALLTLIEDEKADLVLFGKTD